MQDTHTHTHTWDNRITYAQAVSMSWRSVWCELCHKCPLDICVTFVISKCPLRRCTLPLNQFCAFKVLLVALCFQNWIKLDGLQEGFTFPCFKGTKCRVLSTGHYAVTWKSHACVDLNLHADSHSHGDLSLSRPILLLFFSFFTRQQQKHLCFLM